MGWKNLSYTRKGGIIAMLILIVVGFLAWFLMTDYGSTFMEKISMAILLPLIIIGFIIIIIPGLIWFLLNLGCPMSGGLFSTPTCTGTMGWVVNTIAGIISLFIFYWIGVGSAKVIGKFKSRKQKSK